MSEGYGSVKRGYAAILDDTEDERDYQMKRIRASVFFTSRSHLFSTNHNVRGFRWTPSEAQDFWEDFLKVMEGQRKVLDLNSMTFVQERHDRFFQRGGSPRNGANGDHGEPRQTLGDTFNHYEVRCVSGVCFISQHYNIFTHTLYFTFSKVYDGQQRLTTISLLVAALAIVFAKNEQEDHAKRAKDWIYPDTFYGIHTTRIGSDRKEGALLEQILTKPSDYVIPSKKERKTLSTSERCIIDVLEYFIECLNELVDECGTQELLKVHQCLEEKVYVTQQIPPTSSLAYDLVLGQSRGMKLEALDYLRGQVDRRVKDDDRDKITEEWMSLEKETDRTTILSGCLYQAQAYQKEIPTKHCVEKLLERYVEDYFCENPSLDGQHLFTNELRPACSTLDLFRKRGLQLALLDDEVNASLEFLLFASKQSRGKEIEMVVLKFLLWHEDKKESHGKQKLIKSWLKKLESVAVWILVTIPSCKVRRAHCFKILEQAMMKFYDQEYAKSFDFLSSEQKVNLGNKLFDMSFDESNENEKALVKAILGRLERHSSIALNNGHIETDYIKLSSTTVTHIWNQHDVPDQLYGRLGNFALAVSGERLAGTETLKERFGESKYLLSKKLSQITATSGFSALENHHKELVGLASTVWDLNVPGYAAV
jgi:hypothetical protein